MRNLRRLYRFGYFALFCATLLATHTEVRAAGSVQKIQVYGEALANNLQKSSPARDVWVYLPPSYATSPERRYPVVYLLHGFMNGPTTWVPRLDLPASVDKAIASGAAKEMILVLPDALTVHHGSMYASSVTTGDWETYIVRDLVGYIDKNYRTIAKRESRGLAGYSMGGHGTFKIGMKSPGVASSLYALSPCCMVARPAAASDAQAEGIDTLEKLQKAGDRVQTVFAQAAAWSPDPRKPPFYVELPTLNGAPKPDVLAKWAANAPAVMLPQYVPALKTYRAIGLEVGTRDSLRNHAEALHESLDRFNIAHDYETYDGDHSDRIPERFATKLLPFFSKHLDF